MKISFRFLILIFAGILGVTKSHAEDFFSIREIKLQEAPMAEKSVISGARRMGLTGVWEEKIGPGADGKPPFYNYTFIPSVEVQVETQLKTRSKDTFAHLYFYDQNRKLLKTLLNPSVAKRKDRADGDAPIYYSGKKTESLFFAIPNAVAGIKWTVLAVFGDKNEAAAKTWPQALLTNYDFPEKDLASGKARKIVERKEAPDSVIECPVHTGNSKQPMITLFLRFPSEVRDASEIKGVLALCLLADNVDQIRNRLQGIDVGSAGLGGLVGFAEKNHLAILAWGSRSLWNPNANHDEQTRQISRELDRSFDKVAEAWEMGVKQLSAKYGIPTKNYILWGQCGSAQWAHRLALRKPDYFLAVHVHIPGSFDQPTPEAAKILWCLTTGELYSGYERSNRFYADCRDLGYPMVYKAIVGLGHAGSPLADALGMKFFEYALSVREQREAYDEAHKNSPHPPPLREGEVREPWIEAFRRPAFVGDLMNQEIVPFEQQEMVPVAFRVPLPTKEIADAWNLQSSP